MGRNFQVEVYNGWAWERAWGPLPGYRKRHSTAAAARAEAVRVARIMRRRGDGRAVVIVRDRNGEVVASQA